MADAPKGSQKAGQKGSPADERLFTIPLRKEFLKVPSNKRAKRSVSTIRSHLSRHMKAPESDVKLSGKLNDTIWTRGAAKPPGKIRLKASFDSSTGHLHAMLPDEKPPEKDKKSKSKDAAKAVDAKDVKKAVDKTTAKETEDDAAAEKTKVEASKSHERPKEGKPAESQKAEPAREARPEEKTEKASEEKPASPEK